MAQRPVAPSTEGRKELEVSLYCGLCGKSHQQKLPMPEGWDSRYRSVSDEHAFCPKHSIIAEFADSQCPGCVGGWGDCGLWEAFAYRELKLTESDFRTMEAGTCPKRVNGSMMFERGKITDIDLRDPPVAEAGKALSKAIRAYSLKYHKKETA